MKHNAANPKECQGFPLERLSKTELMVYKAITPEPELEGDQNLVEQVAQSTRLTELQVRSALFLLLRKNVISSDEIIDLKL